MKKKKIIKAQLGRIIKDNLSPQQKAQLDTYKKTVVDERSNKENDRRDQEQKDSYMKRISEYQAQPKYKSERMPSREDAMEEPRRERMPSSEMEELKELYRMPMQGSEGAAQGAVGEAVGRKKGGMTKSKKKIIKAYIGKAIRQPTETDNEFKIRQENYTPFSDKYYSSTGLEDEKLQPGKEYMMKKGGMTKAQKKVGSVMREFKAGKLHSGKKGPVVKSPKQAIAIALSEAGMTKKKMQSGGMVRGSGIAIRGIKKSRIY
jgi:hypothetical protein